MKRKMKMKMKKRLLMVAILTSFSAPSVHAAVAEAPLHSAGAGELTISGTIVNSKTDWSWEIPAASAAATVDWDVDKREGVIDGNNTVYDFTSKGTITGLNGVMVEPSPKARLGILPVIEIGGQKLGNVQSVGSEEYNLKLPVKGDNNTSGFLEMSATIYTAATARGGNNQTFVANNGADNSARSLLKKQPYYSTTYTSPHDEPIAPAMWEVLTNTSFAQVSAAVSIELEQFKLIFATNSQPSSTWAASLPIVVTVI
ncbi:hypothetical protein [Photobacterium kishitanii]|uniref:F4 family fimbrial subunit n=1 Tax=Photobacterium kishitanii TaxID=318456 RepID=UPI00056D7ACE|nr:hypothetical protein [Photobacterium kishitanii]